MEKVIKKHLTITSVNRGVEKLEHEIYSKDKGTAVFKFTTDELTASKVLCLFYFKDTKRYRTVEATIEGNTITVPFDSTLITTDEPVICYVYFEKVEQSTDVYAFAFNVRVSAIDRSQETPLIERVTGRVVDVENIVTKQELDALFNKIKVQGGTYDDSNLRAELGNNAYRAEIAQITGKIEALEQKTDKDTIYNDEPLKRRLEALESKTKIDASTLVTKQELASKGYLTEHQPLTEYAKKTELTQPYNDTELKSRVQTLETKTETLATKDELKAVQLKAGENRRDGVGIPQKLSISGNVVTLSDGGGSITLPATAPATSGNTGQANEYEIHGTGMPNGKVTAPVGTTYVDTAVTNGALKWIKRIGNDNKGWDVLSGDTGWRRLSISSGYNQSSLHVRRVNNIVTYKFGGLQRDMFGIVRRGGPGYISQSNDLERNVYILFTNRIPIGYRSVSSLIGSIYDGTGSIYGSWFIGGTSNSNYLMFHFNNPVSSDNNTTDIYVPMITYVTDDPWPDR
jgi:hypothetical protein